MRNILLVMIQLLICGSANSQSAIQSDTVTDLSLKWLNLSFNNPWLLTDNAAGLKGGIVPAIGSTFIGTYQQQGDFKRPQQAQLKQSYIFYSERFQPVKKGVFYGSFRFEQQKDEEIHWNTLMDPYRGTPYILADSIGGDWKKQVYQLNLKAASAKIANRLFLGAGVTYNLSTGARQNDPRPLNYVNELDFKPALLFDINEKHAAGLTGTYGFYKEEINLLNNKSELLQKVFRLKGLAVHDSPSLFSSSFTRLYEGAKKGAELQYAFTNTGIHTLNWLTTFGFQSYNEDVRDGITKPTNGGKYKNTTYHLTSTITRSNEDFNQQLQFSVVKINSKGREYHQSYDPVTTLWQTTFDAIFYTQASTTSKLAWQLVRNTQHDGFNWKAHASIGYNKLDAAYLYSSPVAQNIETSNINLGTSKVWSLKSRNSILLSAHGSYVFPLSHDLNYILKEGHTNQTTREILLPDYAYLASKSIKGGLTIQYTFASNKPDAQFHNQFYVKGAAEIASPLSSENIYQPSGNRKNFALTIGAFY